MDNASLRSLRSYSCITLKCQIEILMRDESGNNLLILVWCAQWMVRKSNVNFTFDQMDMDSIVIRAIWNENIWKTKKASKNTKVRVKNRHVLWNVKMDLIKLFILIRLKSHFLLLNYSQQNDNYCFEISLARNIEFLEHWKTIRRHNFGPFAMPDFWSDTTKYKWKKKNGKKTQQKPFAKEIVIIVGWRVWHI